MVIFRRDDRRHDEDYRRSSREDGRDYYRDSRERDREGRDHDRRRSHRDPSPRQETRPPPPRPTPPPPSRPLPPPKPASPPRVVEQAPKVPAEELLFPPGRLNRPDKIVLILRGLPGSGKSPLAKKIKDIETENGGSAPRILSIDDYFLNEVVQRRKV